jgi:hypothetical protein
VPSTLPPLDPEPPLEPELPLDPELLLDPPEPLLDAPLLEDPLPELLLDAPLPLLDAPLEEPLAPELLLDAPPEEPLAPELLLDAPPEEPLPPELPSLDPVLSSPASLSAAPSWDLPHAQRAATAKSPQSAGRIAPLLLRLL